MSDINSILASALKNIGPRFKVYRDSRQEFRWRLVASNGKTVADSGEGYKNKADCIAAIEIVKATGTSTPVDE